MLLQERLQIVCYNYIMPGIYCYVFMDNLSQPDHTGK